MRALLLQGPVGPFFTDLHRGLLAQGWDVRRVCIDGGDLWTSGSDTPVVVWNGRMGWEQWLEAELDANPAQVVVLFGSERPAHLTARRVADKRGIPVLSLEEGYKRPGYLTAEWGGNNRSSRLAHLPLPAQGKEPQPAAIPPGMGWIVGWTAITYTARVMYSLPAQWSLYHRRYSWPAEVLRWGRNLVRRQAAARSDAQAMALLNGPWAGRYDVLALQVPGDSSLVAGGDGWTTERFLDTALRSFVAHAPADRKLVAKIHPLARGHADDGGLFLNLAARHGVRDRVTVVQAGPLAPILAHARGLAAITSTSTLASIERGLPTLVLGEGITRRSDLAICGPEASAIDRFWSSGPVATPETLAGYKRLLAQEALVPGDAYHPNGRAAAVAAIAQKLEATLGAPKPATVLARATRPVGVPAAHPAHVLAHARATT
jgi:capsular polysaccharide export protein